MKTFPVIRDLVTDVSWNYRSTSRYRRSLRSAGTDWLDAADDVERSQEFRKCIECFLCQDVCHVLRDHN